MANPKPLKKPVAMPAPSAQARARKRVGDYVRDEDQGRYVPAASRSTKRPTIKGRVAK